MIIIKLYNASRQRYSRCAFERKAESFNLGEADKRAGTNSSAETTITVSAIGTVAESKSFTVDRPKSHRINRRQ